MKRGKCDLASSYSPSEREGCQQMHGQGLSRGAMEKQTGYCVFPLQAGGRKDMVETLYLLSGVLSNFSQKVRTNKL